MTEALAALGARVEAHYAAVARGAMADVAGGAAPRVAHRFFHVPASNTAVGHLILEDA